MVTLRNGMYYDVRTHRVFRRPPDPSELRSCLPARRPTERDRSFSLDSGRARRVVLILTERCNLACSYCYAGHGAYGKDSANRIADKQVDDILNYLENTFPSGIENLQFFGGEPLLETRAIRAICERAPRCRSIGGSAMSLVTNGTVLSNGILETLRAFGVAVTVSLDGPAQYHDRHRVFKRGGRGSFSTVTKNVARMASAGVRVAIQLTISPTIVDAHACGEFDVEEFADLLKAIGAVYVHLAPVIDVAGGEFSFSEKQLERLEEFQAQMVASLSARGLANNAVAEAHRFLVGLECNPAYCGAGLDELTIDVNGDLYPCFMFINRPEFLLGNIYDGVANMTLAAELEANRKARSEVCAHCDIVDSCKACIGASLLENGSITQPSSSMCRFLHNNYFLGVNELVESIRHE